MTKDLAFADTEQEIAATRRFLERVPKDQLDWRPHEKSMTLGRLSMHCAEIPGAAARIFETDEYHYNPPGDPPAPRREESTTGDAVALLDTNAAKLRELLRSVDDASLARPWTFKAFGHTIYTVPKLHAYRIRVLNHSHPPPRPTRRLSPPVGREPPSDALRSERRRAAGVRPLTERGERIVGMRAGERDDLRHARAQVAP